MNTLIVIESLTIVNLLNKVQFPFAKVFPLQMLSSSSEGAIVQSVPITFAPVLADPPHYGIFHNFFISFLNPSLINYSQ